MGKKKAARKEVAAVLREYGEACRNGFSLIEGREVKQDLDYLSYQVIALIHTADEMRSQLGFCIRCKKNTYGPHWSNNDFSHDDEEDEDGK